MSFASPRSIRVLALWLLALLLLAGCGGGPAPTPTPTKTPIPVAAATTADLPTQAPAATATPLIAATPVPPTATPTPEPTATATPTVTPDASLINPATDPGVSPFTGLRPADPAVLARRPLAIKVSQEQAVIPQAGLNKADVVVESRVEYNMTRFTAIYHSQDAERVGPIRSARLIDLDIPVFFDAVFAFSGAVQPVRELLYGSDFADRVLEQARNGPSFFRDPNLNAPHNLFADTRTMWETASARGWNQPPRGTGTWVFAAAPAAGGRPASRIDVPYAFFPVRWTFDAGTGRWLRFIGGEPHTDRTTGEQLSAANVINLQVNHAITLIVENGVERQMSGGICINCSVQVQLWGEGPLQILRDGQVFTGKWVRPERLSPLRFLDAAGRDIPLKPGNSWWQVTPLELSVRVE